MYDKNITSVSSLPNERAIKRQCQPVPMLLLHVHLHLLRLVITGHVNHFKWRLALLELLVYGRQLWREDATRRAPRGAEIQGYHFAEQGIFGGNCVACTRSEGVAFHNFHDLLGERTRCVQWRFLSVIILVFWLYLIQLNSVWSPVLLYVLGPMDRGHRWWY